MISVTFDTTVDTTIVVLYAVTVLIEAQTGVEVVEVLLLEDSDLLIDEVVVTDVVLVTELEDFGTHA